MDKMPTPDCRLLDGYLEALEALGVRGYSKEAATRHFHLATTPSTRYFGTNYG